MPRIGSSAKVRAERGGEVAGGVLGDRHRRERDDRDQQVEAEHGGDGEADAAGDRAGRVLGLLGHVGDRLDPGVGDHPDRDPEREVAPGRGDAEVDVVDQDLRAEDQDQADPDQHDLGGEVGDGEDQVQFRRLLGAADVDQGEGDDQRRAADDVAGAAAQPGPEDGQVVGHEEGRDRDRDRVVEHLPPGGDEADQLVEGVAGEAGGAAGLRVHHRRLGVGGGGGGEDQAGDDEGDRGQAEGEGGGDAERVVDRGADVAVGGGEQRADAVDAAQRFVSGDSLGHLEAAGNGHSDRIYGRRPVLSARGRGSARPARRSRRAPGRARARRGAGPGPARRPPAPAAARPQRAGRPTSTASAPRASAIATSTPRRMPPSTRTVARPATASTTSGRASPVASARSSWRPPWLETTTPGRPVRDRQLRVLGGEQALDQHRQAGLGGELARGPTSPAPGSSARRSPRSSPPARPPSPPRRSGPPGSPGS